MSKDKVRRLLGFFSSPRMQQDWKAAKGTLTNDVSWDAFLNAMRTYYKPTENHIIRNFEFRQLEQKSGETFSAFCNRVEAAGKECHFCDCDAASACNARDYAVRDQVVMKTNSDNIRGKAMLKDWNLKDLRTKGMKCESAAAGEEKISGINVNRVGNYSFKKS